jgi:hypothetical protein
MPHFYSAPLSPGLQQAIDGAKGHINELLQALDRAIAKAKQA